MTGWRLASSLTLVCLWLSSALAQVPPELQRWLEPQDWQRDRETPIATLGPPGAFDDMHIFAPCVRRADKQFWLWYCGSRGDVAQRVFQLGLARSSSGLEFQKHGTSPVFAFGDGRHSVLTPTVLREGERWRMWFAATDFAGGNGLHTLHEATSDDGIHWSEPSPPLLEHVYAPTVLKIGNTYRLWYTRVDHDPWVMYHATSTDGRQWRVSPQPVLQLDQDWESSRLFYPAVVHHDGAYVMWYGSYWKQAKPEQKTALGCAVSLDGLRWYKHPQNPVFRPEPSHDWESHYVTSQSVLQLDDGSWRMWYASRTKPPFVHKYFALGTARWTGPPAGMSRPFSALDITSSPESLVSRQEQLRQHLRERLGIPANRVPLLPEQRGQIALGDIVIEKWVFTSEAGSRVPALVYRPAQTNDRHPAIVLTYGHGGSKSTWEHQYAGQLYARLGIICLAMDPLGEEERHERGDIGTRAHDHASVDAQAAASGRLVMGKLCFDAMRGIDFLQARTDVDSHRIGVAGYSLGGATGAWLTTLDPRIRCALICGWAFDDVTLRSKLCTRVPNELMRERMTWADYVGLTPASCALLVMNGDADIVIDSDGDHSAWQGTERAVAAQHTLRERLGANAPCKTWLEPGGGHRPYFLQKEALLWLHDHLGTPAATRQDIESLRTLEAGPWLDARGVRLERLYGTPLHWRGTRLPDVGVKYHQPRELAVLPPEELGKAEFTIEGWLQTLGRK